MQFQGILHPAWNEPLIDVVTAGGEVVDLHNDHDLVATTLQSDSLSFAFTAVADGSDVVLRFHHVRDLRVEQPLDWADGESTQIDHVLFRPAGPWRRVTFRGAGGFDYEFDCEVVTLMTSGKA